MNTEIIVLSNDSIEGLVFKCYGPWPDNMYADLCTQGKLVLEPFNSRDDFANVRRGEGPFDVQQ